MASMVDRPNTEGGSSMEMWGSSAARPERASTAMRTPGMMTHPS